MFKVTLGGTPFDAGGLEKSLLATALSTVKDEMRLRISAIRHPDTGEFPTVRALGETFDDLRLAVEGSPELLQVIQDRLNEEDRKAARFTPINRMGPPKAFLSHLAVDHRFKGRKLGAALQLNPAARAARSEMAVHTLLVEHVRLLTASAAARRDDASRLPAGRLLGRGCP